MPVHSASWTSPAVVCWWAVVWEASQSSRMVSEAGGMGVQAMHDSPCSCDSSRTAACWYLGSHSASPVLRHSSMQAAGSLCSCQLVDCCLHVHWCVHAAAGVKNLVEKGYKKISPFFIPYAITNMGGALLAIDTGFMVGEEPEDRHRLY